MRWHVNKWNDRLSVQLIVVCDTELIKGKLDGRIASTLIFDRLGISKQPFCLEHTHFEIFWSSQGRLSRICVRIWSSSDFVCWLWFHQTFQYSNNSSYIHWLLHSYWLNGGYALFHWLTQVIYTLDNLSYYCIELSQRRDK